MKFPRLLEDLVAAAHSPFHPDGSLAPEVVEIQARHYATNRLDTVFITGSTGESHSLAVEEKLELYEAWSDAGPKFDLRVVAHVGGNCLADARTLARAAERHGFSAISALAPSYYRPANLKSLVACCADIAAAAPSLPFYFYDIPALTRVEFPMADFLPLAARSIPNFAGVKFTNPDLVAYRHALDLAEDRFELPWGVDESLLAALATGASGAVGSTYNWAPDLYRSLIDAFRSGDLEEARRLQSLSIEMIQAIAAQGFLGSAKALMGRLGVPVGPARLPLENPAEAEIDALMATLERMGLATWVRRSLREATLSVPA